MSAFGRVSGVVVVLAFVGCGGSSSHTSADSPLPAAGGASSAGAAGAQTAGSAGNSAGSAGVSGASAGSGTSSASGANTGGVSTGGANTGGASAGGAGGAGTAGSAGAGGSKPTLGCAGWSVDLTDGSPANVMEISGGARFTRPAAAVEPLFGYFNGADVALEQSGLTGDFDVQVSFKDFVPGDGKPFTGPRAQAGVWWHDPVSGSIYQATGSIGEGSADATLIHGHQFTLNYLNPTPAAGSLVGASGSFHITRVGTVVTVQTIVNGALVSAQSDMTEPFSEQPLTLFLALDDESLAYNETATQDSAITFSQVQVTGGGGQVKSDDFSCP